MKKTIRYFIDLHKLPIISGGLITMIFAIVILSAISAKHSWMFSYREVYPNVPGNDEVACGDIDRDGKLDILCSQADERRSIRWFKNPGNRFSNWQRSETVNLIHDDWKGEVGWMGSWLGDFDGDGDIDVVSGAKGSFSGIDRPLCWFENVNGNGSRWVERPLPVNGDYIDNCRTWDFNKDGRDDIIAQKYHGSGVYLLTCPSPGDPGEARNWKAYKVGEGRSGLSLADVDMDGNMDIVIDNKWLKNPGDPNQEGWPSFSITGAPSGVKNAVGDLNGDKKVDIVLSSEEGSGIWWFSAPDDPCSGGWLKHTITEDYIGVHSLWLADFNLDGSVDILVAEMHTKGRHRVTVFENSDGKGNWIEHVIATVGSHNALAVDLDGDGWKDIVGSNFADTSNPLQIWYNAVE